MRAAVRKRWNERQRDVHNESKYVIGSKELGAVYTSEKKGVFDFESVTKQPL